MVGLILPVSMGNFLTADGVGKWVDGCRALDKIKFNGKEAIYKLIWRNYLLINIVPGVQISRCARAPR